MVGEVVNNYRIISLLGEGGMGAVYLAEHPFMGRKAAIKVLRRELAEDPSLVERFMNEARAANAIRHPNIIDIIDVGRTSSGVPYLMMEFLEGRSLAARIADAKQLPIDEAIDVATQTTAALAAAHAKGIVHRDLKPDNLFLVPDESRPRGERVKVLDFGIAKLRGDLSNVSAKTQTGSLMGTPPYMSPEQCRGVTDDIDHRTDVYAMGVIVYEMLCGAPPFVSAGWGEIVLFHMTKPPPPPRAKNARISPALEAVILKALAKTREERFGSMAEMQAALRGAAGAGAAAPVLTPAQASPTGQTVALPPAEGRPTTTFRSAAAETSRVVSSPGRAGRRMAWIGGAAALAVGIWAVAGMPGRRTAHDEEAVAPRVAAVAVPTPPPPPPSEAPAPPRDSPAPPPAQILLRLASEPGGATITDARSGAVLGATPFERRIDRGPTALSVRVAKPGFAAVDLTVPLAGDYEKIVRLEKERTNARAPSRSKTIPAQPARAAAPAPAPEPVAAPAPAPAAPAAPAPRRAERW
jgi:serine/threonine-protein kinase